MEPDKKRMKIKLLHGKEFLLCCKIEGEDRELTRNLYKQVYIFTKIKVKILDWLG